MIFDRLCAIAEKTAEGRAFQPLLRRARLFLFPGHAHVVLPKLDEFEAEDVNFLWEQFFLPFPVIAIEDTLSCVVLWGDEDQHGLNSKWYFIECMPLFAPFEAAADCADLLRKYGQPEAPDKKTEKNAMMVTMGWVRGVELLDATKFGATFDGNVALNFAVNAKSGDVLTPVNVLLRGGDGDVARRAGIRNGRAALEEVMYFNTPHRFVVERMPAFGARTQRGKLPRSDSRPTYQLKTVTEIRRDLALRAPSSRTTASHSRLVTERRSHWRHYPEDETRWPNAHGTSVRIPASWVGPTDARIGNHIYKVRIDL